MILVLLALMQLCPEPVLYERGRAVFWINVRLAAFDSLRSEPRFQRLLEASRPPQAR